MAALLTALGAGALPRSLAAAGPPLQAPAASLRWFTEARFGMFIHWGLYALLGRGEWVMFNEKIPVAEYEKLQQQFNPTRFNAAEWVELAKRAGMKYITITSKHHDGFCLFDSALTTYTAMHTPAKRDFIAELTRACQQAGLGIFYYYSLLDWHHPAYRSNLPAYVDYAHGQVRELCSKYGRISGIWFDGGWEHSAQEWRAEELVGMIRKLQPHALVNDRARWDGDFWTPEQNIPAVRVGGEQRPFECCFTINNSWGYNAHDRNFKSAAQLVRMLADIVGRGGNLLLNVGPLPSGEIPEEQAFRLRQVGEWLASNGEAIYGCTAGPFPQTPWGACTAKQNMLYLHLFEWPGREMTIGGLKTRVRRAWTLKGHAEVKFSQREGELRLRLPALAPDPYDTVVALELAGLPQVELAVRQAADGSLTLTADLAEIHGRTARVESKRDPDGTEKPNIGYWVDPKDWVSWPIWIDKGGEFEVSIEWANEQGSGGSEVEISLGPAKLTFVPEDTGSWGDFRTKAIGTVRLAAGQYEVAVRPRVMKSYAVTNLRAIRLRPVQ